MLCLRDIDLGKVRFDFPVLPNLVEICTDENRVTPRVLEWLRQQPRLQTVKLWSSFTIDESRWLEVQSALPGMTVQDRLGEVLPKITKSSACGDEEIESLIFFDRWRQLADVNQDGSNRLILRQFKCGDFAVDLLDD